MSRRRPNGDAAFRGETDYADNTKYDEKYIMPTNAVAPDFGTSSVYGAPVLDHAGAIAKEQERGDAARTSPYAAQELDRTADYGGMKAEAPMVFALRNDPTLFVYEYADRLEYYRNTPTGMMLCNVEYKKTR